jgi:transposase
MEPETDARQQRGLIIAATAKITKRDKGTWIVPSQSQNGRYAVTITNEGKLCTCPDFELRRKPCKHVYAVQYLLFRETTTNGDSTTVREAAAVRVTYAQNWPAYNAAQTTEKAHFAALLHELCATVPNIEQNNGRKSGRNRLPLGDMIFAAGFKVYSTASCRRFMTDLREAQSAGYIGRTPHFNSIFNYLELEALTPIVKGLITQSALPLKAIETDFAIDSTGFTSTQLLGTWQTEKYGGKKVRTEHDWVKLHAMCGVLSNVVVAVEVTPRNSQDSPQFPPLVEVTAANFNMQRVLGDKAYSSHANLELVRSKGAMPYIPFKSYAIAAGKSATWDKLLGYYLMNREEFLRAYHKRSNAESTFSAIKRVFGDFIRSRTPVAQVNEVLLKVLAHNIRCLIHSMYEIGINPSFCAAPLSEQKPGLLV